MTIRNISTAGVGLIAALCLVALAPASAQTSSPGAPLNEGQAQVMRVQQDLNNNGFNVPMDGIMGSQTETALRNYQQQHGLPPTGRIDGQTFTSLEGIAPPSGRPATVQVEVPSVVVVPGTVPSTVTVTPPPILAGPPGVVVAPSAVVVTPPPN